MKNCDLYRINLSFACAGVWVEKSSKIIQGGAPIFNGWKGKSLSSLQDYYEKRGKLIDVTLI